MPRRMLRYLIIGCLCLFIQQAGFAQQTTWKLVWSQSVSGEQVYADRLGDVYVVKGDQISKIKSNGQYYRTYSNKNLGRITTIDAGNPLKTIVFYKDFSRVVFLDNTLTDNGEPLKLEEMNRELASVVCWSYDNGIWIYDPLNFSLTRLNQQLKVSNEILNLNQILGFALQPSWMLEYGNHVYMSVPDRGILQFDNFGTYMKTIPLKGVKKFAVNGNSLFFVQDDKPLSVFDLKSLQTEEVALPKGEFKDFAVDKNKLIVLSGDSVEVYQYMIE